MRPLIKKDLPGTKILCVNIEEDELSLRCKEYNALEVLTTYTYSPKEVSLDKLQLNKIYTLKSHCFGPLVRLEEIKYDPKNIKVLTGHRIERFVVIETEDIIDKVLNL